jgi:putative oxidoreductase
VDQHGERRTRRGIRPAHEVAETVRRSGGALHIALWIGQVLLFLAFGISGWMKLTMPIPELAANAAWVADIPVWMVRFIGAAELAGAVGVLLPALTRIVPVLTPLAAAALALVMLLAILFHLVRGEPMGMAITFALGALAGFVGWGRFRLAPIPPR